MAETKKKTTSTKKKGTSTKKSTTKKTTTKKTSSAKKPTTKKVVKKTTAPKKVEVKEEVKLDPKTIEVEAIDTKEERDEIVKDFKKERKEEIKEIKKEVSESRLSKRDKLVDLGIVVVMVGLFILVLTVYLTGAVDISTKLTNNLVIIALLIEAIGIAVIIYNTIRK